MAASDAERLNNAIYSIASINPQLSAAVALNERWQQWFERAGRNPGILESPGILQGFWRDYAAVRAVAQYLSERTPPAAEVEPEPYATATDALQFPSEGVRNFAAYAGLGAGVVVASWLWLRRFG